jgi:hypothetical protein
MQKRLRTDDSLAGGVAVDANGKSNGASNAQGAKSVMAEMGSKGGKIGGKRRAENMSPEQRRASASRAARARWSGEKPQPETVEAKREAALRKIAAILEEQMTSLGLSEDEKNAKAVELVAFVSDAVSAKLAPPAKQQERPHSVARRA